LTARRQLIWGNTAGRIKKFSVYPVVCKGRLGVLNIMKYKVKTKQFNSRMCLVCGMENKFGLKAFFYELENDELVAIFSPLDGHQSYPGRLHGGIASAILDETIGRAILLKNRDVWGVTVELNLKYRKPIPLDQEIKVVGRIEKDSSRFFEGSGEIMLDNGEVAVKAWGKYLKLRLQDIIGSGDFNKDWKGYPSPLDPEVIELESKS
jgi:acyl-coenzyme A thioesterase PaaI-like protein